MPEGKKGERRGEAGNQKEGRLAEKRKQEAAALKGARGDPKPDAEKSAVKHRRGSLHVPAFL